MSKSQGFCALSIAFILGIALRSFFDWQLFWVVGIGLCGVMIAVVCWEAGVWRVLGLCLVVMGVGFWRMDVVMVDSFSVRDVGFYHGQSVVGSAVVLDVDRRQHNTKVTLEEVMVEGRRLDGGVLVTISQYTQVRYGDKVEFGCVFEEGGVFDGFDYGAYLAKSGVYAVCYRPEVFRVVSGDVSGFEYAQRSLYGVRDHVHGVFERYVHHPEQTVLSAMVLGLRREIPAEVSEWFARTGTSHVVAISGLHITLLVTVLWTWLVVVGVPRRTAFVVTTVGLVVYLLMIGFRASALRAGLMGWLVVLAGVIGRKRTVLPSLLLAASLLLVYNPRLLRWDIGFQLSFMAVTGIHFFEPKVSRLLEMVRVPNWSLFPLRSSVALTVSAQALTFPLIVYYFELLSVISIVANVLVVPLLPLVMFGGMAVAVTSLFSVLLPELFGWAVSALLGGQFWVLERLSGLSFAAFQVQMSGLAVFGFYGTCAVGSLVIWFRRGRKKHEMEKEPRDEDLEITTIDLDKV